MAKKYQLTKLLKERLTLLHKQWNELPDGSFSQEIERLGEVWGRLVPIESGELEKLHEWYANKERKPKFLYKIAMRKYFSSIARHAMVNALGWNHKVLDVVNTMQFDEDKTWLEGIAADYGEEI